MMLADDGSIDNKESWVKNKHPKKIESILLASASSKEGIEKMINEYFYSSGYYILQDDDGEFQLKNDSRDRISEEVFIVKKKGRFQFRRHII